MIFLTKPGPWETLSITSEKVSRRHKKLYAEVSSGHHHEFGTFTWRCGWFFLYINTVHRYGVKTDLIFINPFVGSSEAVLLDGPAAEEDRPPRPPTSPEQLTEGPGDLHDDGRARWWINSSVAWNIDGRSLEKQNFFHVPRTCFLSFSPDCAAGIIFSLYNYR